jgi:hypothetical protein
MLDLPKTEAESAVEAFEENSKNLNQWDLNRKIREKVFWRLIEERAKQPPHKDEVALYLKKNVFDSMIPDKKKIFKLFMGEDYSESLISKVKSLPVEKLFFLMAAMEVDKSDLPNPGYFETKNPEQKQLFSWLGSSEDAIKKLYKEEIKALMPKAKPPEDTKKAGGEKSSGKKADAKKPAKAKK